jgi:putative addiction module CopG family antidote
MEVDLTADQREFIRQAIETGRFHRAEDAVREALLLWEERECRDVRKSWQPLIRRRPLSHEAKAVLSRSNQCVSLLAK